MIKSPVIFPAAAAALATTLINVRPPGAAQRRRSRNRLVITLSRLASIPGQAHDDDAVAGGLRLAGDLAGRAQVQAYGEGFRGDHFAVRPDRVARRAVGADGEPDAVRHVQAGVPAGLLHDPDHIPRGPLGG